VIKRRALFFTKYGEAGASSRYRVYAYLSRLRDCGWAATVQPLLPDRYIAALYATGKRNMGAVLKGVARRSISLRRLGLPQFNAIVVQCELFPHLPFFVEAEFYYRFGDRIVVDYDDAMFAMYQESALLRDKIAQVMRSARLVVVGNEYLAAYARAHARRVAVVPTAIETSRYQPKREYGGNGERLIVGWIGTPVTTRDLASAAEAFQRVARVIGFTLRCVGASPGFCIPGVDVEVLPWSEGAEPDLVRSFDVGVMPLVENAFTLGKCGLKLIQYMGCAVPPVAARLGANCEIICDGENGYLASTQSEFAAKIIALLRDAELRQKLGRAARATIERSYSMEVTGARWCALLNEIADGVGAASHCRRTSAHEKAQCVSF
jgi:glycosyltransferase involved in cell wall biosynthesis